MGRLIRRYNSTLYGNYRKAYLVGGIITGVVMSIFLLLNSVFAAQPMSAPENYLTELILLIGILITSYLYRKQLPDEKVSLKELMLVGLGVGVISGLVFGLIIWFSCSHFSQNLVGFYNQERIKLMDDPQSSAEAKLAVETVKKYTAGDWGFIAGFRSAVMSIIITFFTALVLRTEKSPVMEKRVKQK
ncbi:MAG: DUF4199 domain-containing protein [Bacteroidales bacterium]|nr:DUF4199 domain-containing protein [Bacteroidales bacterium]